MGNTHPLKLPVSQRSTANTIVHTSDYICNLFEKASDEYNLSREEQAVLLMLFRSIMARCQQNEIGINRKIFLQFISLPGLWGEVLFDRFDQDKDGFISQKEFNTGMGICIRSSDNQKLQFLFSLFDIDTDGYVTEGQLVLMLANIAPLIHIQKIAEYDADSDQLAQYPNDGFVGISENELNIEATETDDDAIGAYHAKSAARKKQGPHRVYETRSNKSLGVLNPHAGGVGGGVNPAHHFEPSLFGGKLNYQTNKTQDPKQINDFELFAPPLVKSSCIFHHFKLTRVDEQSAFNSELPYPDPDTIKEFAKFVVNLYKQRCKAKNSMGICRSEEFEREMGRNEPLKSSFLNNLRARNSGLNFQEFKLWMKDLPIFTAMFSEMNYETIFEDFNNTQFNTSTTSLVSNNHRSRSEPPRQGSYQDLWGNQHTKQPTSKPSSIPLYKRGYLMKKGRKLGGWKQRYFILRGKFLFCLKRSNEKTVKKCIFLPGCQIDSINDIVMTRKYGFRITEPNGRFSPLRLYASTSSECKAWVESLKRAGGMVAIIEKYTVCQIIGRGKFSVVKRAINKQTGKQLAVKIIDKKALNPKELQFLRTELQILKVVRHPNLVHIYDITEFRDRVYIFMEYMQFGELN